MKPSLVEAGVHVGVQLRLPLHWAREPLRSRGGPVEERAWCGPLPSEWCVVEHLEQADPAADVAVWQEASMALAGTPLARLTDPYPGFELVEWARDEGDAAIRAWLDVDDAAVFTGMVVLPDRPPELARVYTLVVRRATDAWRVALGLSSACLPGSDPALVQANDHVRAGAMLGQLRLGAGST